MQGPFLSMGARSRRWTERQLRVLHSERLLETCARNTVQLGEHTVSVPEGWKVIANSIKDEEEPKVAVVKKSVSQGLGQLTAAYNRRMKMGNPSTQG